MANKSWKAFERRLAKRWNGERVPVSGRQTDKGSADVITPLMSVQAKLGYDVPGYLREWVAGIESKTDEFHVPVVVWKPKYVADDDALVVLRARELDRLLSWARMS